MTPRVSFIIPVRNDALRLEACLRSIRANSAAPGDVEIVVVDNASTDGSGRVAERFGAQVVPIEGGRVAELRNRGTRHARSDVFAFVDADHEIVAGWVAAALECLSTEGVGAVGALCHAPENGTWVQRVYGYLRGVGRGQRDVTWLGSGNMAVRRVPFETLEGFDTSLETCEDVDLCHRLRARGLRIISDARLKNIHYGDPRTLREVFASERWRGRDNLRVSFRRPIAWTSLPSAIIPICHVALVGLMVLGVILTPIVGRSGAWLAAAAGVGFFAASAPRIIRAAFRAGHLRAVMMVQALAVACAYDVGRAFAVISRAPHRTVRGRSVAATS